METSTKSSAINHGLYLGALLSGITILCYAIKIELLVNFWLMLLILPIIIISFGIFSTINAKKEHGGFITFKNAFSAYFITIAIGSIISAAISFLIFNVIDPEAAIQLKEIAIEKSISLMESFGAPQDEIAKQMETLENQDTQSVGAQLFSLAKGLIFFSVIGLIISLILKKNPENA